MRWHEKIRFVTSSWLHKGISSSHGRIVLCGLLVGLAYFPFWFGYLFQHALRGRMSWFLIAGMLGFTAAEIYSKRQFLKKLAASNEDRLLGHLLIFGGAILFPFFRSALWSQALIWLVVLAGITCSTWGVGFFYRFRLPTVFIALSVYPRLGLISRTFWEFIAPVNFLENGMAGISASAMRTVGWHASADGRFIVFPEGSVEVGWGCNGLDMAVTIAIIGLFMGLFFNLSRLQIVALMAFAVILAFPANIPRLMLVTIAYVYWGRQWFDFWHGFWGGQIFATILFTLYYYIVMALIKEKPSRVRT